MGFFDKMFGKKREGEKISPPPLPVEKKSGVQLSCTGDPLMQFAQSAIQTEKVIDVSIAQVCKLIHALQDVLKKTYPDMQNDEILSQAEGGLSLRCPYCGQLSDQVIPYLLLSDSGIMQNAVFMGPNVAALAQGRCPGCGGTRVFATFNPAKVMARMIALQSSATEAATIPIPRPERTFPYRSSLTVAPGEKMAAWVSGGDPGKFEITIVDMDSGEDMVHFTHPGVEFPPTCFFVGDDRLLVKTSLQKEKKEINLALIDPASGKKIAETDVADTDFRNPCVNHTTKTIAAQMDTFSLITVDVTGDKFITHPIKTGQIYSPGPRLGPDGKFYIIVHFALYRMEGDEQIEVMRGDNCICIDPMGKIFSGGGFPDRSGESMFHVLNLKDGTTQDIPWGKEPVDQIELAGEGEVLIGTGVNGMYVSKFPNATVTLYSLKEGQQKWTIQVSDLTGWSDPLMLSTPKDGWALIRTGKLIKQIALKDGKTMRILPKEPQEIVSATWLASRKTLCLTRMPGLNLVGALEWYRMA
jgi:hypothetical protein